MSYDPTPQRATWTRSSQGRIFQGVAEGAGLRAYEATAACRLPTRAHRVRRGRAWRSASSSFGKVKIGRRSRTERENLLTIIGPSDMFGELSIFDPGRGRRARPRSPKCARCRWTATTARLDRRSTRDRRAAAADLGRLRRTNKDLADLIFTDVPGRVAEQLLQLAQRFGTQEAVRCASSTTSPRRRSRNGRARHARPSTRRSPDFADRGCWDRWRARAADLPTSSGSRTRARSRSGAEDSRAGRECPISAAVRKAFRRRRFEHARRSRGDTVTTERGCCHDLVEAVSWMREIHRGDGLEVVEVWGPCPAAPARCPEPASRFNDSR